MAQERQGPGVLQSLNYLRPWSLLKGLAHPAPAHKSRHSLYRQQLAFVLGFLCAGGFSYMPNLPEVMESSQELYGAGGGDFYPPFTRELTGAERPCLRTQRLWVLEPSFHPRPPNLRSRSVNHQAVPSLSAPSQWQWGQWILVLCTAEQMNENKKASEESLNKPWAALSRVFTFSIRILSIPWSLFQMPPPNPARPEGLSVPFSFPKQTIALVRFCF